MQSMIKIGSAGTNGPAIQGLQHIAGLGLTACEIEFVRGVYMNDRLANEVGAAAKKLGIALSVHAPYYINLASKEAAKRKASAVRILQSCERGFEMGASHIVFHAAYYQDFDKEQVYEIVRDAVEGLQDKIKEKGWKDVMLAPETTGKKSQFGDLNELLRLMEDTRCSICIDFAHLKARENGRIDYMEIFEKIKRLKKIHCHFSGIEYSEKGERNHILTEEKDIRELLGWIKKYKLDATIINESPNPIGDAVKTLNVLKSIH